MEGFSVGICDDNGALCGMLERLLLEYGTQKGLKIDCEVYHRGELLQKELRSGRRFDLLFLDCNLGSITGAAIGETVRRELDDFMTQMVFMTGMEGHFEHLMEYQPLRFLRKPLSPPQVSETMGLAVRVLGGRGDAVFRYKVRGQVIHRPLSEILYFEGADRCVWVVWKDGRESFYGRLRDVAAELEPKGFWHVHRGFLVNSQHVRRFYSDRLLLTDGAVIPISQKKRKSLREIQEKYAKDIKETS